MSKNGARPKDTSTKTRCIHCGHGRPRPKYDRSSKVKGKCAECGGTRQHFIIRVIDSDKFRQYVCSNTLCHVLIGGPLPIAP